MKIYIKEAREKAGLSQKELALKVGVAPSTFHGYESGNHDPKSELLKKIAQVCGVSIDFLLGHTASENTKKEAPSGLPEEALKVAKDYTALDQPGKNVVRVVIAEEGKRVQAEKERRKVEPAAPSEGRLIPLYFTPSAAGMMEPAVGEDFDYIEVGPEVSRKADCAIRISGDSMEPYIMDQSIVYVTREPLENGDVGIFYVDGDMLCKQYYKDEDGNVRLLSLNRERRDADRFIHRNSDTVMTYYGRVILPHRPIVSWA